MCVCVCVCVFVVNTHTLILQDLLLTEATLLLIVR